MRFGSDDNADEGQVEDRRGMSFGGPLVFGGGGLGIVGVIAYVLIRFLGGDPSAIDTGGGQGAPSQEVAPNQALGGSCQGVTSDTDNPKFISCVVSNVQRFWSREMQRRGVN
jgi:uncharacterized protein